MSRPTRIFAPLLTAALLASALIGLSACAEPGARPSSAPAPTVTVVPGPASSRSANGEDPSLRIDGGGSAGGSCRQQCERSHNVCMDSVAARTQSGLERPDSNTIFSPSENCSYQLNQCFQRCNAVR